MHVILDTLPTTRKRTRGPHTGDQNIVHTNAFFDAVMHAKKKMKEEEWFLILQNPSARASGLRRTRPLGTKKKQNQNGCSRNTTRSRKLVSRPARGVTQLHFSVPQSACARTPKCGAAPSLPASSASARTRANPAPAPRATLTPRALRRPFQADCNTASQARRPAPTQNRANSCNHPYPAPPRGLPQTRCVGWVRRGAPLPRNNPPHTHTHEHIPTSCPPPPPPPSSRATIRR
jgi:hypothetical protein